MAEDFSIPGVFSQKGKDGTPYDPVGKLAGLGGLIGLIAGIFGLVLGGGQPLIRIPLMEHAVIADGTYFMMSAAFVGLLSVGLLLQMLGSRELRVKLGSGFSNIGYIVAIVGILLAVFLPFGGSNWTSITLFQSYVVYGAALVAIFVIFWQMYSIIFVDASKSWIGMFASILNGFFIPLLAIGYIFGPTFVNIAYIVLILGQLFVWFFWWAPLDSIREYGRSPDNAKFSFGLSGVLAFTIGSAGVINNIVIWGGTVAFSDLFAVLVLAFIACALVWFRLEKYGVTKFRRPLALLTAAFGLGLIGNVLLMGIGNLWIPFSQSNGSNYVYVFAFTSALLFWVLQGPRLSKKELKEANITSDIVSGGIKYFAVFLAAVGIYAASQSGTLYLDVAGGWGIILTWCTSGVLFLIGAIYVGRTDIITGLPLVIAAVMMSVHPMVLAEFVVIPFVAILITQVLLMIETRVRGFTYFSQPVLTVIATIVFSITFMLFMLGAFGSGPTALWPVNRWFNVALFPNFPSAIQAGTVFALPLLVLIVRNTTVVGYSHGTGRGNADVVSGITMLFAFLIPMIAAAFKGVAHMALTAASIMLALYAISFILVLSVNLNLAGDVEDTGNPIEGMLLRMTAIVGVAIGAVIALYAISIFSAFPTALQAASVITWLVILISSLEILLSLGWLVAGYRLGMLRSGFRFRRVDKTLIDEPEFVAPIQ
ncbi:MAG: hypothetical protein KAR33_00100 [Candidatus Thorarchaeota archaeon]|nr:hypothetical protein [Candidatus Thorarchaeota archaeon]